MSGPTTTTHLAYGNRTGGINGHHHAHRTVGGSRQWQTPEVPNWPAVRAAEQGRGRVSGPGPNPAVTPTRRDLEPFGPGNPALLLGVGNLPADRWSERLLTHEEPH